MAIVKLINHRASGPTPVINPSAATLPAVHPTATQLGAPIQPLITRAPQSTIHESPVDLPRPTASSGASPNEAAVLTQFMHNLATLREQTARLQFVMREVRTFIR